MTDNPTTSQTDDLDDQEQFDDTHPHRDMYDELLDDPDIRAGAKEEIKRRLLSQGQQQGERPLTPAEQIATRIREAEQWQDEFWKKGEDERDFAEWERRKAEMERLRRQEDRLILEERETMRRAGRAKEVTDNYIKAVAQRERRQFGDAEVTKYADRIRVQVEALAPDVRADEVRLKQFLEHVIIPRAYKEWHQTQRGRTARDDAGNQGSYDDDGAEDDAQRRDPFQEQYPDASPEERQFLEGVGLVKRQGSKQSEGLIPHQGGYYIPVGRGKRNPGGEQ